MGYLYRRNSARWNRVNIYDPTSSKACATVRTYTFVAKLCHGASNELRAPIPSRAQVKRSSNHRSNVLSEIPVHSKSVRAMRRTMHGEYTLKFSFCSLL